MNKILLLILLSFFSNANWLINGKIVSDSVNIKTSQNLAVQLWLRNKESKLLKNRYTPFEGVITPQRNIKVNFNLTLLGIKLYKKLFVFLGVVYYGTTKYIRLILKCEFSPNLITFIVILKVNF